MKDDMKLQGKVAMISGGSKGLGADLARRFVEEGANVSLCARHPEGAADLATELRAGGGQCLVIGCDVTDEAEVASWVAATVAEFGRVDVLVNNASVLGARAPIAEYPADVWRTVIDVNLTGAFLVAKACIEPLSDAGGSMIHISSGVGDHGRPNWGAYCASKNGLEALSEMLAGELADAGVRSNAVDPGAMRTVMRAEAYPDEDPAGVPTPYQISDVFVYLASDEAAGVTGQRLRARDFEWPQTEGAS
ncbi:MAG: SDR family oxidoreductase [Gemmatimonadetes bacterium]|nr:SDR family oxidoreductase [Gemmatimonadota bacterium]